MRLKFMPVFVLTCFAFAGTARAGMITTTYSVDAGGSNANPLNGLAAMATFETSGNTLNILLKNTSTGMRPASTPRRRCSSRSACLCRRE